MFESTEVEQLIELIEKYFTNLSKFRLGLYDHTTQEEVDRLLQQQFDLEAKILKAINSLTTNKEHL